MKCNYVNSMEDSILINEEYSWVYEELLEEIFLYMDVAFPEWRMDCVVNPLILVSIIVEENGFLFVNSNVCPIHRLSILYKSISETYKCLKKT